MVDLDRLRKQVMSDVEADEVAKELATHREFVEAFTTWHDHPNVEHHSYETAHSDMITKWRKVIGR